MLGGEALGGVADTGDEAEALALAAGPSLEDVAVHPVDARALARNAAHSSGSSADGAIALPIGLGAQGGCDNVGETNLSSGGADDGMLESSLHEGIPDGDADGEDEGSDETEHVEARR